MQGKLIVVAIVCVHIETNSLWVEFVNKNRCISVRLVPEEVNFLIILKIYSFLGPELFIDYFFEN